MASGVAAMPDSVVTNHECRSLSDERTVEFRLTRSAKDARQIPQSDLGEVSVGIDRPLRFLGNLQARTARGDAESASSEAQRRQTAATTQRSERQGPRCRG